MDSLTVYHLARELDARWRGGTIRAGRLDRETKRVVIAAGHGLPVEIDLSTPDVVVREGSDVEERGPPLARVDTKRLQPVVGREGKREPTDPDDQHVRHESCR